MSVSNPTKTHQRYFVYNDKKGENMKFWIISTFFISAIIASICAQINYPLCVTYRYKHIRGRSGKNPNEINLGRSSQHESSTSSRNCHYCGIPGSKVRILGGQSAVPFEFPWLVNIEKDNVQHCGGSILNNRYIMTAAHCLHNIDYKDLVVMAAVHDVNSLKIVKVGVRSVVVHPQYEPQTYDYDIALLKLAKRLRFGAQIRPICLPPPNFDATGTIATVAGWGATAENSEAAETLLKVYLPVVSTEMCKTAKGLAKYKLTDRMICAGDTAGGKDACKGDSGGPLVISEKNVYMQVGIVSWGVGCARPDFYGVYTKVNLFLDWIAENSAHGSC